MQSPGTIFEIWQNLTPPEEGAAFATWDVDPRNEFVIGLLDEVPKQFKKDGVRIESTPSEEYVTTGRGAPGAFRMASFGPRGCAVFSDELLLRVLRQLAGTPVRLNKKCSCYLEYYRPGDYIAVHRDIDSCEATVLIYLKVEPAGSMWPVLNIYPDRRAGPIVDQKRAPLVREPVAVRCCPGRVLMMVGSEIPHERPPLVKSQRVLAAAACYCFPG